MQPRRRWRGSPRGRRRGGTTGSLRHLPRMMCVTCVPRDGAFPRRPWTFWNKSSDGAKKCGKRSIRWRPRLRTTTTYYYYYILLLLLLPRERRWLSLTFHPYPITIWYCGLSWNGSSLPVFTNLSKATYCLCLGYNLSNISFNRSLPIHLPCVNNDFVCLESRISTPLTTWILASFIV